MSVKRGGASHISVQQGATSWWASHMSVDRGGQATCLSIVGKPHLCSAGQTLRALATNAASKLDVLAHDGDALSVNRVQVTVLEKVDEVRFCGFLKCNYCSGLPAKSIRVPCHRHQLVSNFTYQTLEWQLANEKLRRLLELADLTKSNRSRPKTTLLLHYRWSVLLGGLAVRGGVETFGSTRDDAHSLLRDLPDTRVHWMKVGAFAAPFLTTTGRGNLTGAMGTGRNALRAALADSDWHF